jgi:hypothetical protein
MWVLSGMMGLHLFSQQLIRKYQETKNEYKQADPVDAMHIADPF